MSEGNRGNLRGPSPSCFSQRPGVGLKIQCKLCKLNAVWATEGVCFQGHSCYASTAW